MQLLDDNPATRDAFGFEKLADILLGIIRDSPRPPFTIGVFGEWGSGKTTLMKMLQASLQKNGTKTVWFNPWKYDNKEVIWNALIQHILFAMKTDPEVTQRPRANEFATKIADVAINLAKYAAKVGTRFIPGGFIKEDDVDSVTNILLPASADDKQFSFINRFEEDFDALVKEYVGDKGILVVFIDDLDRCLPENAISVMEALKLYLDRTSCIFVIGSESSIIEEGIRQRYKENRRLSAKDYLEKIIQLPFNLPPIQPDNALSILNLYEKSTPYRNDPTIRSLIVAGTGCNPRRIKRFVNAFWVLSEIAGSISSKEQQVLAKILLIQMRFPNLYHALTRNLGLVSQISQFRKESPSNRKELMATSPVIQELWDDKDLLSFLEKTADVDCEEAEIDRWILLTKGQAS